MIAPLKVSSNHSATSFLTALSSFGTGIARLRAESLTMRNFLYIVCLMSDRDYLGEFEHTVVLALLRLADRAYGVTVRQEIEVRIGREVSIGAVYARMAKELIMVAVLSKNSLLCARW